MIIPFHKYKNTTLGTYNENDTGNCVQAIDKIYENDCSKTKLYFLSLLQLDTHFPLS